MALRTLLRLYAFDSTAAFGEIQDTKSDVINSIIAIALGCKLCYTTSEWTGTLRDC